MKYKEMWSLLTNWTKSIPTISNTNNFNVNTTSIEKKSQEEQQKPAITGNLDVFFTVFEYLCGLFETLFSQQSNYIFVYFVISLCNRKFIDISEQIRRFLYSRFGLFFSSLF
jgi:hypothetical protein